MAGVPGGPAVMMMLVYSERGEPLTQSRTCRSNEGVVRGLNTLHVHVSKGPTNREGGATHKMKFPA